MSSFRRCRGRLFQTNGAATRKLHGPVSSVSDRSVVSVPVNKQVKGRYCCSSSALLLWTSTATHYLCLPVTVSTALVSRATPGHSGYPKGKLYGDNWSRFLPQWQQPGKITRQTPAFLIHRLTPKFTAALWCQDPQQLKQHDGFTHCLAVRWAQFDVKQGGSELDSDVSINTGATSSECRGQLGKLSNIQSQSCILLACHYTKLGLSNDYFFNCINQQLTFLVVHYHHTTPQPFYGPFPGPPRWASARRELLDFMVQGKINRGRHTNHPAGRHFIRTNQCPPPPSSRYFLQAGCPSCHPTNSIEALKVH